MMRLNAGDWLTPYVPAAKVNLNTWIIEQKYLLLKQLPDGSTVCPLQH